MKTFADLQVGEVLPALDATITQELIDSDVTMTDDAFERSGYYGAPIAPPWVTHADFDRHLRAAGVYMSGIIAAKSSQKYFAPLKLGTAIHTTCEVVERYERKGRDYVVLEFVTTDDQGTVLIRKRDTFLQLRNVPAGEAK
jgi:hypothetical protein